MNPISNSLLKFLKDDTLRVAVVKGEWGTGKTFFWRNFFTSVKKELHFRAYSYVSLFGAQEIADLKRQVFSNFEMLDEKGMSKHLEKLKPLSAILKSVEIPYINSSGPINDMIEAKLVENFLICIDDLERKETPISCSSLLGFISQLKEEKSCKVILIYNDQKLDDETKKQINEYREKVVDLELTYRPTIDDNLLIMWPEGCPAYIAETFHTLELNNIRVMQRVKWALDYFSNEISKYPNLQRSFEAKCVTITVLHYVYGSTISLDEILSMSYISSMLSNDEEDKERFDVIKKLNFISEEQDAVIAEYLVNGYVNFSRFNDLLVTKNEQYRLSDINERHREIWSKYHSNFVASQDEFVELQIKFLTDHIKDLGVRDVVSAVTFIRDLNPEVKLDHLLAESIDLFVSKVEKVENLDMHILRKFPDVIARIEEKLAQKSQDYSMKELFVALAGSNSWNPKDIKHLLKYKEEDFFQWISTENSVDVIELLREFLQRFGRQNEDEKTVVARIMVALETIKTRSPIDRFRVEYLIEEKQRK